MATCPDCHVRHVRWLIIGVINAVKPGDCALVFWPLPYDRGKHLLGSHLMKAIWPVIAKTAPYLQKMSVGSHSTSGGENKAKEERMGTTYDQEIRSRKFAEGGVSLQTMSFLLYKLALCWNISENLSWVFRFNKTLESCFSTLFSVIFSDQDELFLGRIIWRHLKEYELRFLTVWA